MKKSIKNFSLFFILISYISCDVTNDEVVEVKGELTSKYTYVKESLPGKITFINTSENSDSFMWNFGDGTSSTEMNPVKTFPKTGDYTVELTAKNSKSGVSKTFSSTISLFIFDGGLVTNGNFGTGALPWTFGVANPIASNLLVNENGNTYFSIDVTAAGNAFDVNLSQKGINIVDKKTYRLTFEAWSSVNRSILAGIGLSGNPWTNKVVTTNLTTAKQNFSFDIEANFTSVDSRVIFDMGAAKGRVNIDNVTLNLLP